jgi:hypothetical protein
MNVNWLIEDCNYDKSVDLLIDEIKNQHFNYKKIKYADIDTVNLFDNNDCVVVQSSMRFAEKIKKIKNWIPGVWFTKENYECISYYDIYKDFLFNSDFIFSSVKDISENRKFYFEKYGKENKLFIRPSNGYKSFTGALFD